MKPDSGTQIPSRRGIIEYLNELDHKLAAQGEKATSELFDVSFHYSYKTKEITGFGAFRTKDPHGRRPACQADFAIKILGCEFRWHGDDLGQGNGRRVYKHPALEDGDPFLGPDGEAIDMEEALCHALDTHIETMCPCHQSPILGKRQILEALEAVDSLGESYFIRSSDGKNGPVLFLHDHNGHGKWPAGLVRIDLETAAEILEGQDLPLEIMD